ncbi:hypothetical protein ABBQ38_002519 [Trebouxia sp. C0009 RCD-2024]
MSRPRSSIESKDIAGDDVSAARKASLGGESDDQSPRFHRPTAERETRDFSPRSESPLAPQKTFASWLLAAPQPQAKPVTLTSNTFASVFDTSDNFAKDWDEFDFLHINLGPDWKQLKDKKLFANVCEVPSSAGWECPPGLGTCALGTILNLCHTIHNWIKLGEQNAVLVAGSNGAHTPKDRHFTKAQAQYGAYFHKVLFSGTLQRQQHTKVTLRRVTFNALDKLLMHQQAPGGTSSPSLPSQYTAATESTFFLCGASTGFTIETPVHGDITIGIWLGKHKRDRDVLALAYQFHTEMLDADQWPGAIFGRLEGSAEDGNYWHGA